MDKYCIVGKNLSTSLSPFIYHYIFEKFNIGAKYIPIEKDISNIRDFITNLKAEGFSAAHICSPFKKIAMELVDSNDSSTNSVSFINVKDDKLLGDDNDYSAMAYFSLEKGIYEKNILVIGDGPEAESIVQSFVRTQNKVYKYGIEDEIDYSPEYYILVNAISDIGNTDDSLALAKKIDFSKLKHLSFAIDIAEDTYETVFLKEAIKNNIVSIDGLYFLAIKVTLFLHTMYETPIYFSTDEIYQVLAEKAEKKKLNNLHLSL